MDQLLTDTCVASYILKNDTRKDPYLKLIASRALVISFMSLAELYRWPRNRNWSEARKKEFLEAVHKYPVMVCTDAVCWEWAQLMDMPGRPMPFADAWIAATALAYKLPLVTHNRKDFEHITDLELLFVNDAQS